MWPGTGGGVASNPFRLGFRSEYAIFKPMSEWQQDEESDILILYLPGFLKEKLKAEIRRNIIRVRGERQVANNKWNRIWEEFQIPENCETKSIHAKFRGGILTITLPRKTAGNIGAKDKRRDPQEPFLQSKTASIYGQKQPSHQKVPSDPKPRQGHGNSPPDVNPKISNEKPTDEKSLKPLTPQKWWFEEENDIKSRQSRGAENAEAEAKPITSEKSEKPLNKIVEQEWRSTEKSKLPSDAEIVSKKIVEKENTTKDEAGEDNESKGKQRIDPTAIDHGVVRLEKHKKKLREIVECKEERQLVVNIGVAMLVIVAIGVLLLHLRIWKS
ncbi:SHSP domain-containing protein [Abeliophyllum distichum]|uniref:SHSP domain-containing protein n=1 Tax=Abeliophyllum distichum TaxID=126358 RepID=A0ABD1TG59_9LAMI